MFVSYIDENGNNQYLFSELIKKLSRPVECNIFNGAKPAISFLLDCPDIPAYIFISKSLKDIPLKSFTHFLRKHERFSETGIILVSHDLTFASQSREKNGVILYLNKDFNILRQTVESLFARERIAV